MGTINKHNGSDRDFDLDEGDDGADTAYGPDYKTREGLPFCLTDSIRIAMGAWVRTPERDIPYEEEAREKNRAEYQAQVDEGWMPANAADFLKERPAIRTDDMAPLIRTAIESGENVSTIELLESLFPTYNVTSILRGNRKAREQNAA